MEVLNVPRREDVSSENQSIFDNLNNALGFVPNLYATMAHSTHGLKKYLAFQNAKSSFTNKEKEIINLVVSQINECKYCLSAHTVIGKLNGFTDEEIIHIRKGKSNDVKYNALIQLATDLTKNKGKASDETIESFINNGYQKEHIVDLVLQISDKTAMNYLHNLTQIEIDFPLAPEL